MPRYLLPKFTIQNILLPSRTLILSTQMIHNSLNIYLYTFQNLVIDSLLLPRYQALQLGKHISVAILGCSDKTWQPCLHAVLPAWLNKVQIINLLDWVVSTFCHRLFTLRTIMNLQLLYLSFSNMVCHSLILSLFCLPWNMSRGFKFVMCIGVEWFLWVVGVEVQSQRLPGDTGCRQQVPQRCQALGQHIPKFVQLASLN